MAGVKEVQVTLYDVFGFLLPGTVVVVAAAFLFCLVYLPPVPTTYAAPDLLGWVISTVLAYFGGHMAQSLGNITEERLFTSIEEIVLEGAEGRYRLADQVIAACKVKMKETLKVEPEGMKAKSLYRQCDDAVLRSGKIGEREVYVYREGFYRGSAIAFALLSASAFLLMVRLYISFFISLDPAYWYGWSIALWIVIAVALLATGITFVISFHFSWKKPLRWTAAVACLTLCVAALLLLVPRLVFGMHEVDVDGWEAYREIFWFILLIALACSYLSFRRYRRFGMYRVTQAMHGFVSIKDDKKAETGGAELGRVDNCKGGPNN